MGSWRWWCPLLWIFCGCLISSFSMLTSIRTPSWLQSWKTGSTSFDRPNSDTMKIFLPPFWQLFNAETSWMVIAPHSFEFVSVILSDRPSLIFSPVSSANTSTFILILVLFTAFFHWNILTLFSLGSHQKFCGQSSCSVWHHPQYSSCLF